MARNALGKGLSALIREPESQPPPIASTPAEARREPPAAEGMRGAVQGGAAGAPLQVDIDLIDPSPFQPRTRFNEDALEELARSLRATGMIQPLVLRRAGVRYQLIAGERRWRSAQRAGMQRVPAIVREVPEDQVLELTLVENIQREDLNPLEQARAFERLMAQFGFTQEMVAERTGKDRATVANTLRLLRLEPGIQQMIEEGKLSAGHGRALLAIESPTQRKEAAGLAARGRLNVRQIERLASRLMRGRATRAKSIEEHDANTRAALEELQRALGTKVSLKKKTGRAPGQLIIEYYDDNQLNGLYEKLVRN